MFPDSEDFIGMVLAALRQSLHSSFGRSNTKIQVLFIDTCSIPPVNCTLLLVGSILTDNKVMFDLLLERKVPVTGCFEQGKTLLHLCAQNPNNTTTIQYFAQQLLKFEGVDVNLEEEHAMFTGDAVLGHGTAAVEHLRTWMDTLRTMQSHNCVKGYPTHGIVIEDL